MKHLQPAVVALGMFDGVHLGHQQLIKTASAFAQEQDAVCCAYTFSNHPFALLGRSISLLTSSEQRYRLLQQSGAEKVHAEPFDADMMHMSPSAFIDHLQSLWDLRGVVAGFNYTFGDRGAGTTETLQQLGKERGFGVRIVSAVQIRGETVSSTRIRALLQQGDVRLARQLLGRPYSVGGTVKPNLQNGRKIGFPTANLLPPANRALPAHGVYLTEAVCADGVYCGVTNIGTNPTLQGDHVSVETHLLDYCGELYGSCLEVRFLERIRDEQTFASIEALRERIRADVCVARRYLEE